jgi:hypothetical protein
MAGWKEEVHVNREVARWSEKIRQCLSQLLTVNVHLFGVGKRPYGDWSLVLVPALRIRVY